MRGHFGHHEDGTPAEAGDLSRACQGADQVGQTRRNPALTGGAPVAGLMAGVPFHHPLFGYGSP
jgi:hypothetical protein